MADAENQCIEIENATRDDLPLSDFVDLSAADVGCPSGSLFIVEAVTADGVVVDSLETTAD